MNPDTKNLKDKIKKAGLKTPTILTLMITEACNLGCHHCLLNCKGPGAAPVHKEIIINIIDEFSDLGGKTLIFTGGEPLLHPDWYRIIRRACDSPGLSGIVLQTNAVIVTGEDIKKIKLLNPEKIIIQVSLDGATAETNDLIRGKGSFNAVISALNRFNDAGMAKNVKIAFTEMKHNYDEIPEMLRLADASGVSQFTSGTIVKGGRAENTDWIELPHTSQIKRLITLYEINREFRALYDRLGNVSAIEWYKWKNIPSDHVCNCINTPFINTEGMMYPCVMNFDDNLAVDNVHEQGLSDVILKGLEKWSYLPEMDKKRSESLTKCKDCAGRKHCRGGCIGRALAVSGDIMSVEDRCELRREVYYLER